ncbi:MAG TPA: Lrp/AsnC family transcriptional regulator [Candidatus Thermoplasmatota archaeon]|nr:Lrp/AsnC family transcriptional regulator [Candidatus Thermoplasmatota archaeon]
MPKISARQITLDENKVMTELQKDSKQNIDAIAKRCGFSRQKVWKIIKKFEKNKTIWGYHAVIDQEKIQKKNYLLLIKKSNLPASKILDIIVSRELEKEVDSLKIFIMSSTYLHGSFDWQIAFTADDIRIAKKFCEIVNRLYQGHIGELVLIEEIFPVKTCGIQNPNIKRLHDYV